MSELVLKALTKMRGMICIDSGIRTKSEINIKIKIFKRSKFSNRYRDDFHIRHYWRIETEKKTWIICI